MFDGLDGSFRKIKLRPRQNNCVACGEGAEPTLIDYEQFCGTRADDKVNIIIPFLQHVFFFFLRTLGRFLFSYLLGYFYSLELK